MSSVFLFRFKATIKSTPLITADKIRTITTAETIMTARYGEYGIGVSISTTIRYEDTLYAVYIIVIHITVHNNCFNITTSMVYILHAICTTTDLVH